MGEEGPRFTLGCPIDDGRNKMNDLDRIIDILKEQPDISQNALGESLGVTRRIVQKYTNALKEAGRIERVGGKRFGHWEIRG